MTYKFDPGLMAGMMARFMTLYIESRTQGAKPEDFYFGLLMMVKYFEQSFGTRFGMDLHEISETADKEVTEVLETVKKMGIMPP